MHSTEEWKEQTGKKINELEIKQQKSFNLSEREKID